MLAVFPVFIAAEADRFWLEPGPWALLSGVLARARDSRLARVLVVTDSPEVAALAKNLGLDCEPGQAGQTGQPPRPEEPCGNFLPLPRGGAQALGLARARQRDPGAVALFDFRNPALDGALMDQAITAFSQAPQDVLLSVCESVDHPCQLAMHLCVQHIGLAHLFDTAAEGLLSLPFACLPEALKAVDAPGYGLVPDGPEAARLAVSGAAAAALAQALPPGHVLAGIAVPGLDGRSPAWLVGTPDQGLALQLDPALLPGDTPFLLRLAPLTLAGPLPAQATEALLEDPAQPIPLPEPGPEVCGYAFSLLTVVESGPYELSEPFPAPGDVWSFDAKAGVPRLPRHGRVVAGRQDFPLVLEPDGTLCVLPATDLDDMRRRLGRGAVAAFRLPDGACGPIRTVLDHLRLRAARRAA